MRSTSTAPLFSSAALALTVAVGTLHAQQARNAELTLLQQIEAIDAELGQQPKSIDRLFDKAELLARHRDMDGLRRCREQLLVLFREQDEQIERWLRDEKVGLGQGEVPGNAPGGVPGPSSPGGNGPSPLPGFRPPGDAGGSGKPGEGDGNDRGAGAKKAGVLLGGSPKWKDLEESQGNPPSPSASTVEEQFEQGARDLGDGDDESAVKRASGALLAAAIRRSPAPAVTAQLIRRLATDLRRYLEAGLADLLTMLLERSDPSSVDGALAEQSAEQAAYVAELMAQLYLHSEAIASLERSAALRGQMRPVVAALLHLFESWVARIDIVNEQQREELVRQQQLLLDALKRLHAVQSSRPVVEQATRGLSKSRAAVADDARRLLVDWCAEHLQRAQQFLDEGKVEAAAAEYEQTFVCDNSQRSALAKAVELLGQLGRSHARVRHLKYLARTEGEHAEESRAQLAEMWQEAGSALVAALEELARTYSLKRPEGLEELLRDYPILAGKEEQELLDAHRAEDVGSVVKILRELAKQLKGDGAVEATPLGPVGKAPQQGEGFVSPLGQVPYRWIAGRDDRDGFWVAVKVVNTEMWKALRTDTDMADDEGGKAGVSYDSALRLCSSLNSDEAEADRLPAGYGYALPTVAEIERMRDASNRLPFDNAHRVLSAEPSGVVGQFGKERKACEVAKPGVTSVKPWWIDPNMGVVFVLRRK